MIRDRPLRCTNNSPQVRGLFQLLNSSPRKLSAIAEDAGIDRCTIFDWCYRQSPGVVNLEAVLNELATRSRSYP